MRKASTANGSRGFLDVETLHDVEDGGQGSDPHREHPGVPLAAPYAPAQHEERDAGGGDEGRRGLGHGDGHEVADDVEPASQAAG